MSRLRLSFRRRHEARDIFFQGQRFSIGIGRNNIGDAVEVFVRDEGRIQLRRNRA